MKMKQVETKRRMDPGGERVTKQLEKLQEKLIKELRLHGVV